MNLLFFHADFWPQLSCAQNAARGHSKLVRFRRLTMERLEERQMLSGNFPDYDMDGWLSGIFDDGYHGDLTFDFSRDVATIDPSGSPVGANEPRFAPEQLATETNPWVTIYSDLGNAELYGSGWDHDGETPLAVLLDKSGNRIYFIRGNNFAIENNYKFSPNDMLKGTVEGYRYKPITAVVHEGLVVFMTERQRLEGSSWIAEGVSFVYTQDYGATFQRVAQVGGGFDVPAIAGGVADGIARGNRWAFSNAFPETSADDRLGAWFPWTDYLRKTNAVKGGQVGLFRARREEIGSPWVVEPNVTVFEDWQLSDSGGFHAHSAGMFTDGLASFWGDVDYRNRMVRHIASDLESYTTATWTQNIEFNGAWSPSNAQVHRIGNQGGSTAPAPEFGEFFVTADLQPELIMKIQRPEDPNGGALITNVKGSFPGAQSGSSFMGRISTSIHYLPGRGYVVVELDGNIGSISSIHYSADGEHWTSMLDKTGLNPYLYGDYILQANGGNVYATAIPGEVQVFSPLIVSPGNTNLLDSDWVTLKSPDAGNSIRRVEYVDGILVYSDTGLPLATQPAALPPVISSAPMYEVISSSTTGHGLGNYEIAQYASQSGENHWFTAWYYALNTDGISPGVRFANNNFSTVSSEWVANTHWVPGYNYGVPAPGSTAESEQYVRLFSGNLPGPRHYLMVVDGLVQGPSPTYPLAPGATGSNELATVGGFETEDAWTVGMVFALPELPAFTSYFEPTPGGAYRPIATIYQDSGNYVEVAFIRSSLSLGRFEINIYSEGVFANRMTIQGVRWDIWDRAELIISASAESYGATLLLPRDGFGIRSATLSGAPLIQPSEIRLSSADQSIVSPMQWFAIQVNPDTALTTSERELLVTSIDMLTTPNALPGDYNYDGKVDIVDYNLFTDLYIPPDAVFALGDYNQDLHINGADRVVWEETYGSEEDLRADGNNNGVIDDEDYDIWLANREPAKAGDYNDDGKINPLDHELWVNTYGSTTDLSADGNGDGKISAADYTIWRNHVPALFLLPDGNGNGFLDDGDYYIWFNNVGGVKTPPLKAGDYDRDGLVTLADFDVWERTYGGTINLAADGNHNGVIDDGDFTVWETAYGGGGGSGSAALASEEQDSRSAEPATAAQPNTPTMHALLSEIPKQHFRFENRRGKHFDGRQSTESIESSAVLELLAAAANNRHDDGRHSWRHEIQALGNEDESLTAIDELFTGWDRCGEGLEPLRFAPLP